MIPEELLSVNHRSGILNVIYVSKSNSVINADGDQNEELLFPKDNVVT